MSNNSVSPDVTELSVTGGSLQSWSDGFSSNLPAQDKFSSNSEQLVEGIPFTAILPHVVLATVFIVFLVISFLRYRMKRRNRAMEQQLTFMARAMSIKEHGQRISSRLSGKRIRPRHVSPEEGFGVMRLHNAIGRMPLQFVPLPPRSGHLSTPVGPSEAFTRSPPSTLDIKPTYDPDAGGSHGSFVVNEILPSAPVKLLRRQERFSDVSDVFSFPTETPDDDVFRSDDSLELPIIPPPMMLTKGAAITDDSQTDVTEMTQTTSTIGTTKEVRGSFDKNTHF